MAAKAEVLATLQEVAGPEILLLVDHLMEPPERSFGDLSFACFPLAKVRGKSPAKVAEELAGGFNRRLSSRRGGGLVGRAEAKGPYLNFFLDASALAAVTLAAVRRDGVRYGTREAEGIASRLPSVDTFFEARLEAMRNVVPGRAIAHEVTRFARGTARAVRTSASKVAKIKPSAPLVMVEVCSPNTHKEIHIGHLRNILIGRTVVNLRRALGEEVIPVSFIEELGINVAKTLWALDKFHKGEEPPAEKGRFLGRVYAEAVQAIEGNPQAKAEVEETYRRLEEGNRHVRALWRKTRAWSVAEIKGIFAEFGVPIRRYYFDSQVIARGRRLVTELLRKGIAEKSEGAVVIDLSKEGLGAFLILKSDGSTLYATKDLGLLQHKLRDYRLDRVVMVVDARQSLYFKQLFAAFRKIGFPQEFIHVPFEFVTLKEGAMSSRKGNVVPYEDFRDEMIRKAAKETRGKHADWKPAKVAAAARAIALGAMAVGMLKQDTDKQIVFDMEEALSFDGFTGPYLQYTLARVRGIAAKAGRGKRVFSATELLPEERSLVLDLARYPEELQDAATALKPARLVAFLFGLAKHFAEFYERVPVLKAPPAQRASRLALVAAVGTVMESGFRILGIPAVEEM